MTESNKAGKNVAIEVLLNYWHLLLPAVIAIIGFWPVFTDWWDLWMEEESYYSHGPLIPLIVGYLIYLKRNKIATAEINQSYLGAALLIAAVPMYWIGHLLELRALFGVVFLFVLFGVSLLFFGFRASRLLAFPLLYTISMIPAATWIMDNMTGNLQLISTQIAGKMLTWSGYEVQMSGNYIFSYHLPDPLLVGSPCSGVRLLISLVSFSVLLIYLLKGHWLKKLFLLAFSIPLAVFINSLRVTMIGYAGIWTGSVDAMHSFHDWSGYINLIICFIILFGVAKLIRMGDFNIDNSVLSDEAVQNFRSKISFAKLRVPVAIFTLVSVLLVVVAFATPKIYDVPQGKIPDEKIIMQMGEWNAQEVEIDESTKQILSQGDLKSLVYVNEDTFRYIGVFLDASYDISAFHDPHLCLPGGGSPITEDKIVMVTVPDGDGGTKEIEATILEISSDYSSSYVLYWYAAGDETFPSTPELFSANRTWKLNDLISVITNPFSVGQVREQVLSRQIIWYRFNMDIIDDSEDEQKFLIDFAESYVKAASGR